MMSSYSYILLFFIFSSFLGCKPAVSPKLRPAPTKTVPQVQNNNEETNEPEDEDLEGEEEQNKFAFPTLKSWTDEALTWRESRFRGQPIEPNEQIALSEIDKALEAFALKASEELQKNSRWLGQNIPPQSFFQTDYLGNAQAQSVNPDEFFFARRLNLPSDAKIVVMGDFHGSLHSLLRNLWRLKQSNIIANNFKIRSDKVYMIFTGDFVDRGRFSIETLYTLLRLKLANFDRVHLIRGNHESVDISFSNGFYRELIAKYADNGKRLFSDTTSLFRFLPVVIFTGFGTEAKREFFHFSHGGYAFNSATQQFLHSPKTLLKAPATIAFEQIPEAIHSGYTWTDFGQQQEATNSVRGLSPESGAHTSGLATLDAYLNENNIKAVFRGHQDQEFGLKMFFKDMNDEGIAEAQRATRSYENGPYYWKFVVKSQELIEQARLGISISPYAPVFTFTTAAEGQQVPFDAYGIVKLASKFENVLLEIHETSLPKTRDGLSFVNIEDRKGTDDDGIHPTWQPEGPGKCMLE